MTDLKKQIGLKTGRDINSSDECLNFEPKMGTYVINCDVHKDRMSKFQKYASKAGVKACREGCVNGKAFTDDIICEMIKEKIVSPSAEISPIEVAIAMSHQNCWQRIANGSTPYGIVFEDDVEMKSDIKAKVNNIMADLKKNKKDFNILFLWNGNWMETDDYLKEVLFIDSADVFVMKETVDYNAGAVCYIMKKEFAKYLISKIFPIKYAVDIFIGDNVKKGNHYTLMMDYREDDECYISPVLDLKCAGEFGTGDTTATDRGKKELEIKYKSTNTCKRIWKEKGSQSKTTTNQTSMKSSPKKSPSKKSPSKKSPPKKKIPKRKRTSSRKTKTPRKSSRKTPRKSSRKTARKTTRKRKSSR